MSLNGVMAVTLRYFTKLTCVAENDLWRNFASLLHFLVRVQCRCKESPRSLSHLLMNFLLICPMLYAIAMLQIINTDRKQNTAEPGLMYVKRSLLLQVVKERDLIGAQLVRRNDEVSLLYEKMKIFKMTLHKGELQYNDRVEDIRVLKLEIRQQRCKNKMLEKGTESVDDLRCGELTNTMLDVGLSSVSKLVYLSDDMLDFWY